MHHEFRKDGVVGTVVIGASFCADVWDTVGWTQVAYNK